MPTKAKFQIDSAVFCPACTAHVTVTQFRAHGPRQKAILSCGCYPQGTLLSTLSNHPPKTNVNAK